MMQVITKDTHTEIKIDPFVFDCKFNEGLVHQTVVTYMNNARSGNSAQKTRSEVRGGGKKPWNQKGTGRARAGTIRSPLWRSGGVVFAAKKRDYSQKLNKKMYKAALRCIISELYRTGNLIILSDFQCATPKTKDFIHKLSEFNVNNALIVMSEIGENDYLACRNLAEYDVCDFESINPISLLRYEKILMTEDVVRKVEEHLQ